MKRIFSIIGIFTIFLLLFNLTVSAEEELGLIENAKSGILIEQSTGAILYEKEKDRRLSPASMTKIMTLLLIYEAMENNRFDKNTILTTSEYAASMGGSQVYLEPNEKISVDEAIKCVCVASANDCAVLLAEEVSGSENEFVRRMNEKSKELGCLNTNFSDCTGLTSDNHYTSAYDLAIISKELLNKYPEVNEYTSIQEDYIRKNTSSPFWLVNTNKMIGRVEGLNGLKTGYTSFSGYCITLSMNKDNMDLISVVFGYSNSTTRNVESLALLKYGFSNYKIDTILKKGDVLGEIDHILFKNKVTIIVDNDIKNVTKKGESFEYSYEYDYEINNNSCDGNVKVYKDNNVITNNSITTDNIIERRNIIELVGEIFKRSFCQWKKIDKKCCQVFYYKKFRYIIIVQRGKCYGRGFIRVWGLYWGFLWIQFTWFIRWGWYCFSRQV